MLNAKAIKQISSLNPLERYQYFLKKVADYEEMWILVNGNEDVAFAEVGNETLVPLWSAQEFAANCMEGIWMSYNPKSVDLSDLELSVLSFVKSKKALLDVFPVGSKSGFVVSYEELNRDLDKELENYE